MTKILRKYVDPSLGGAKRITDSILTGNEVMVCISDSDVDDFVNIVTEAGFRASMINGSSGDMG